jgi:O-antigen ligase
VASIKLTDPSSGGLTKEKLIGVTVAIYVSLPAISVLCFGLVGVSGNSIFTGSFLAVITGAIILLGNRRGLTLRFPDLLFFGFVFCVGVSLIFNERAAGFKEILLFALSLAAYPAFRYISMTRSTREAFVWVTGGIVALGTIVTAYAIIRGQWGPYQTKPLVLGVTDVAATYFLTSCGFLIIALTTSVLTLRKTLLLSVFIFCPIAIFSASQVRMTFIAIAVALLLAVLLSEGRQRKYFAMVVALLLTGIVIGSVSRYSTTKTLLGFVVEETKEKPDQPETKNLRAPSCALAINFKNSIAIREALWRDALYLIPRAGSFGYGLDRFTSLSCLSMEPHNSFLQAFIEFGWIGGVCFSLATLLAAALLFSPSKINDEARFAICSLAYIITISVGHGRLSRDMLLFAMLGLAVGVYDRSKQASTMYLNSIVERQSLPPMTDAPVI